MKLLTDFGHYLGLPAPLELVNDDGDLWQEFVQTQIRLGNLYRLQGRRVAARDRIAADIRAVASDPVVLARLTATGQVVSPGTAAEFAASIEEQRGKLAAVAQQLGIKAAQ